jgi:5-methylcytosine-specific restriction endonuclease McrA
MNSPRKPTLRPAGDLPATLDRSLRSLSDNTLLSRLHKLITREKQTTLSILLHLAEVDRRDLYLEYGFSSLFDYCVGALKYSRSAAGRRIASARCVKRYPEVLKMLNSGGANLTTVGHIASILDDDNKDLLLKEIRGKTERQVESIVARYKPPVAYRDRVRPVRVAVPQSNQRNTHRRNPLIFNSRSGSAHRSNSGIVESVEAGRLNLGGSRAEAVMLQDSESRVSGEGSGGDQPQRAGRADDRARTEQRLLIQFLAGDEFVKKLAEVKSLLSNKLPDGKFEDVFETLMDEFIDRHSPAKREERRRNRRDRATERSGGRPTTDATMCYEIRRGEEKSSRYIPARTRDAVYTRDGGRCTYKGKNGKRCGSTHNLHIDHITPFALGGRSTLSNLRLLCGKHNRLEARRILDAGLMDRFVPRE